MKIQFKKLVEHAAIPSKAYSGDAAYDLTAVDTAYNPEHGYIEYGTGLALSLPETHVGLLFPRSSLSKKELVLCNHVGVLDSGYRNEIAFRFKPLKPIQDLADEETYHVGDRIGQLMIIRKEDIQFEEVEELDDSERGTGGFGSSGR